MHCRVCVDVMRPLDSTNETHNASVSLSLQIENLGFKDFPVNVSLVFPTKLEQNFEMTNPLVVVGQVTTE